MCPMKPRHPCNRPDCVNLTNDRFCEQHKKEANRAYNQTRDPVTMQWASSKRYKSKRAYFLRRHPLCVECEREGRIRPGTQLDHIVAHKGDYSLFWDESNWQMLCHRCHSRKTAKEDGGFGK